MSGRSRSTETSYRFGCIEKREREGHVNIGTIQEQLRALKLGTAAREIGDVLASRREAVDLAWVVELLERELDARKENAIRKRIERAQIPELTTLEGFDWGFNPKIERPAIEEVDGVIPGGSRDALQQILLRARAFGIVGDGENQDDEHQRCYRAQARDQTVACAHPGAAAPPIGQDELCYHLTVPKAFVRDHAVHELSASTSCLWPYLMEMLFTLGILMRGPELAKLFHTATFLLTAASIFCLMRRFGDKKSALFGAAVYFFTPAALMQATFGYIDNAVAGYLFLTFYALLVFFDSKQAKWAALAGVFGGFLLSTKYLGLFMLPLAALFYFFHLLKDKDKKKIFVSAGYFAGFVILCGGVWYLRSWMLRGNPTFPFLNQFFGPAEWTNKVIGHVAHGRGTDLLSFLAIPWDLAMHADWFGGEQAGMLFLAFLPLFIFFTPKKSYALNLLWVGLGFTTLWFFVEQNTRFFFPALALFSVPAGLGMAHAIESAHKNWKNIFSLLVVLMLALQAGFAVYHYRDEFLLMVGRADRDHYLSAHERSYPAAKSINRFLKPTDKILSTGESRGFYFDNPFTLEGDFNNFTRYGRAADAGRRRHAGGR